MFKKVILMIFVVLFLLSLPALFAQSNSDGKDPDDMRSYSEVTKEGMTKRTVYIDGKVVQSPQNSATAKPTLREQKKLAEINRARIKAEKFKVITREEYNKR